MKPAAERLLDQCREPVTVTCRHTALDAFRLMRDGDFSQLPVVDDGGQVLGMVTAESLLKAMHDRRAELATAPLAPAITPACHFYAPPRLPELLKALKERGTVLIVSREGRPERIITPYDATEFFRVRSQELLWLDERNCARQERGHTFFQGLLSRLERENLPPLSTEESTDGRQITFLRARHGAITLTLSFSFTVQRTSRLELHIDAPTQAESKRFFETLAFDRQEIETAAGTALVWDRMDRARGCRVSLSTDAFLGTSEIAAKRLENWAAERSCIFMRVVWPRAVEVARAPRADESSFSAFTASSSAASPG